MELGSLILNEHMKLLLPTPGPYKFLDDATLNPWALAQECMPSH